MPLILVTAFLDILGIGILIPVLPDLIKDLWAAEAWTAYSQWIYAVGMFFGWLYFGKMSDVYGRKNMLIATTGLNLLGYIVLLFSLSAYVSGFPNLGSYQVWFFLFMIARCVSGLGWAGFWVIQAYISDISTPAKTKNMWLIGAAFGLAFLVWPAIGGILSQWGIEYVIIGCIIAIAINLIQIIFKLPEPSKHVLEMHVDHEPFRFSETVIVLLILSFWTTLAFSAIQSWSTQYYADVFKFDSTMRGYRLSLVGLIAIIYQGGLVKYVRRIWDEKQMIQISLGIMAVSLALFAWNTSPFWLFFIIPLFPIAMGTFQPSLGSLIANKAWKEVGKVMWYNTSVMSIGNMVGPFLVGTLYASHPTYPFWVSAGIGVLLFLLAYLKLRK